VCGYFHIGFPGLVEGLVTSFFMVSNSLCKAVVSLRNIFSTTTSVVGLEGA